MEGLWLLPLRKLFLYAFSYDLFSIWSFFSHPPASFVFGYLIAYTDCPNLFWGYRLFLVLRFLRCSPFFSLFLFLWQLGMDLVLFHFILPVLMEHLKIRAPVRRVTCWVLTTFCGVTGSKELLLHPALVAGEILVVVGNCRHYAKAWSQ